MKNLINGAAGYSSNSLWTWALIYGSLQAVTLASFFLSDYATAKLLPNIKSDIVKNYFKQLYFSSDIFINNQPSGTFVSNVTDLSQALPNTIILMITTVSSSVSIIVFSLCVLLHLNYILAIVATVWLMLFFGIILLFTPKGLKLIQNTAEKRSILFGHMTDLIMNLIGIKLFMTYTNELQKLKPFQNEFVRTSQSQSTYFRRLYCVLGFLSSTLSLLFIVATIINFQSGSITPGDFILVIMTGINIINNTYQLGYIFRELSTNVGIINQAFSFIKSSPQKAITSIPMSKVTLNSFKGEISFKNVSFSYPTKKDLLKNISFSITPGEKVGILGISGSGKTTVVKLLLNLYPISSGQIYIDEHNIQDIEERLLRKGISVITQEPILFNRSIMENIRYGSDNISDQAVYEAAEMALLHKVVTSLPSGYDTVIGERGSILSGGQKQMISIARAFLSPAPIVIFDEATAHLDILSEKSIQICLKKLVRNKTLLHISHKLSNLIELDRILVLSEGSIVENGTHKELLRKKGLYEKFWSSNY